MVAYTGCYIDVLKGLKMYVNVNPCSTVKRVYFAFDVHNIKQGGDKAAEFRLKYLESLKGDGN